jgi:plastocyanin
MSIQVSLSISKDTINLGETVSVTYSGNGAHNFQLQADNLANPINLGGNEVSGTISFLPIISGSFNVTITGSGNSWDSTESTATLSESIGCTVN